MPLNLDEKKERQTSVIAGLLYDMTHSPVTFIQDYHDLKIQVLELEDSLFRLTEAVGKLVMDRDLLAEPQKLTFPRLAIFEDLQTIAKKTKKKTRRKKK